MTDLFNLDGEIAVVTGGLGQLGQQMSCCLANANCRVAVIDIQINESKIKGEFKRYVDTGMIKIFSCDIVSKDKVENCFTQIIHDLGIPTILVNNAALDSPPGAPVSENGPFETYPIESLNNILQTNITGTFICCQVFGSAMAKQNKIESTSPDTRHS